jgi:hypothetical protein
MARWWKKMSRTDAQQKTKGWPVAYLRMTDGAAGSTDPVTLLRSSAKWNPGHFGRNAVQLAYVPFRVTDDGNDMGIRTLMLSYDDKRPLNHKHPALWIHWGPLRDYLRSHSREKWYVIVEHKPTDSGPGFFLTFQRTPPA